MPTAGRDTRHRSAHSDGDDNVQNWHGVRVRPRFQQLGGGSGTPIQWRVNATPPSVVFATDNVRLAAGDSPDVAGSVLGSSPHGWCEMSTLQSGSASYGVAWPWFLKSGRGGVRWWWQRKGLDLASALKQKRCSRQWITNRVGV